MSNMIVVTKEEEQSFLKNQIQLQKLARGLKKASVSALEVLQNIMESTKDEKVKMACAEKILAFHISVEDKIAVDSMQRMIAEIKLGGGMKSKLVALEDENKPTRPRVDFHTVQEV